MHMESKVSRVVDDLSRRHAIAGLRLSDAGTAGLRLANGAELSLEYLSGQARLFVYMRVAEVPRDDTERLGLLETVLQMNCLEYGSGGVTLALDAAGNRLIAQVGLSAEELTVDLLDAALHVLLAQGTRISDMLCSRVVSHEVTDSRFDGPAPLSTARLIATTRSAPAASPANASIK